MKSATIVEILARMFFSNYELNHETSSFPIEVQLIIRARQTFLHLRIYDAQRRCVDEVELVFPLIATSTKEWSHAGNCRNSHQDGFVQLRKENLIFFQSKNYNFAENNIYCVYLCNYVVLHACVVL